MSADILLLAQEAATWERAKGELSALIALSGHKRLIRELRGEMLDAGMCQADAKWERLSAVVDDFIKTVEDEELHV